MKKIMFLFLLSVTLQGNYIEGMEKGEKPSLDSVINKLNEILYGFVKKEKITKGCKDLFWYDEKTLHASLFKASALMRDNKFLIDMPLNHQGETVLHFAAEYCDDCLEPLLVISRALELPDNCGETLLHKAVRRDNLASLQLLIEWGAKLNTKNNKGLAPVHHAVASSDRKSLSLLLDSGASPDETDSNGDTPLHYCVRDLSAGYIRILVWHNANVSLRNNSNKTAIDEFVEGYRSRLETWGSYALHKNGSINPEDVKQVRIVEQRFTAELIKSKNCCELFGSVDPRCKELLKFNKQNFLDNRKKSKK